MTQPDTRRSAGRPREGDPISDRLPADLISRLTEAAERSGISRAGLLRRLVSATIGQYEHMVLGDAHAVKLRDLCPLCFGYVDGPHLAGCGYRGPLSDRDVRQT